MSEGLEISIVRSEPNRLTIKVRGEDHTLLNLLTEELLKDKNVVFAAYREEHPLTREYTFTIITDGSKAPFDALAEAASRVKELFEQLREQWLRAVEG